VVSAPQRPEAMGEIREICEARGAMLRVVGEDWVWEEREFDLDGQSLTVTSRLDPGQTYPNLQIPLLGEHQMVNAATAVAISELLRAQGLPVSDEAIRAGLRSVEWPGRMELLARAPAVLVDGAHNGDSAGQLARSIRRHFGARPLTVVFGASAGKDVPGMLDALLPEARRLILTRSRNERALDPRELREAAAGWAGPTEAAGSVEEALRSALEESAPDEIICVTGSLFLVTEAREAWLRMAGQPLPELDPQIEAG